MSLGSNDFAGAMMIVMLIQDTTPLYGKILYCLSNYKSTAIMMLVGLSYKLKFQ